MKHILSEIFNALLDSPFVIGFFGAATAVLHKGKTPWWKIASMIIAGAFSAAYLSPIFWDLGTVETIAYKNAITFIVGMLGFQITGGLTKLGEDIKSNPGKYIPARWKKKED